MGKNLKIYGFVIAFFSVISVGSLSQAETVQSLEVLRGKSCDLWVDPQGIPHIKAQEDLSGVACLGYLHGKDRAWQMDYFRKTAQGRKAEFYGVDGVQSDFFMRLLGIKNLAEKTFQGMEKKDQDLFLAYAQGVNQGMGEALKKGVYEFKKAGYEPEPWRAEDSLALILLQSFDQTRKSFQNQLKEQSWSKRFSKLAPKLFGMDQLPWDTTILKDSEYAKNMNRLAGEQTSGEPSGEKLKDENARREDDGDSSLQAQKALAQLPEVFSGIGAGSNSWVVSPGKSETGNAWLANDPHLQLTYPSFWYSVHLDTSTGIDAIGATLPGAPTMVSGTNRRVSWGITNSFMPVARVSYVNEAELSEASSERPWIWIKLGMIKVPFFFKTFRKTAGAQLPILPLPGPEGKAMVLQWTGFDVKPKDFSALFEVLKSKSAKEADLALSRAQIPTWNFVFADVNGEIGYRVVGRVPRFEKNPSFGIQEEKLSALETTSPFDRPLSADEMPHLFNPARGYIVTANNRQWPSDSLWSSGSAQASSFRAFRIEEMIRGVPKHDLHSLQKIQCDTQSVDARFLVPELLRLVVSFKAGREAYKGEAERIQEVLGLLASWDYSSGFECKACGVYRRWVDRLTDDLGVNTSALFQMLRHPDRFSAEALGVQRIKQLVYRDLSLAVRDLAENAKLPIPTWAEVHKNTFPHLGGRAYGTHHVISTVGDENSVNPGTADWNGKIYEHKAGASQRLIVEMSNPPQVYSVVPGVNADEPEPKILDEYSEWKAWSACGLRARVFPLEWPLSDPKAASQVQKIVLN